MKGFIFRGVILMITAVAFGPFAALAEGTGVEMKPADDDAFEEVDSRGNGTGDKYRDFHDGQISASLTIPIDKYFTLTPMIAYSFPLSGNADDLITSYNDGLGYSDNSDYFYGGVTLSIAF